MLFSKVCTQIIIRHWHKMDCFTSWILSTFNVLIELIFFFKIKEHSIFQMHVIMEMFFLEHSLGSWVPWNMTWINSILIVQKGKIGPIEKRQLAQSPSDTVLQVEWRFTWYTRTLEFSYSSFQYLSMGPATFLFWFL